MGVRHLSPPRRWPRTPVSPTAVTIHSTPDP